MKTPSEEADTTSPRRKPVSTIVRLEGAWANTLIRSNLRQEANILSRALQYHQEMVEDPAGRMRERFCMMLRLSSRSEDIDWPGISFPYSSVVAMLPRLRFLGSDVTNRVLARRRVNTPVVAASLWPSTSNPRRVGRTSTLHDKDRNEGHPEDVRKHVLDTIRVELDWVQRREEAQELEALIQDIAGQLDRPPDWLPTTYPEMVAQLAAYKGYFAYLVAAQDFCDIVLVGCTSTPGPRHLRLPGLSLACLKRLAAQFTTAHADSRAGVNTGTSRKIVMVGPGPRVTTDSALEDLWRLLIHPIMKGFDFAV
jgi:hypothetical protein